MSATRGYAPRRPHGRCRLFAVLAAVLAAGAAAQPGLRRENFDRDPGWHGHNNRTASSQSRRVRQDFGYSRTSNAGGGPGEVGGTVTPAAEPAYFAARIPRRTLESGFRASGRLRVGQGAANVLVGFFNSRTINEWRTPNTVVLRLNGRGESFHFHVEYATSRWRAGADVLPGPADSRGRRPARDVDLGPHRWSLEYNPAGAGGRGRVTATLDGEAVVVDLEPGHRADGASFDRFGILGVSKSADSPGEIWLDDLLVNGVDERFDHDPRWDGLANRREYATRNIRPLFDFGFSRTRYAGGRGRGEIGGQLFRGDERYPDKLAFYGAPTGPHTLATPLFAAGRVVLQRGVTDSTTLFGFFHSQGSIRPSHRQVSGVPENFLGIAIEGPSREGFLFYPTCGFDADASNQTGAYGEDGVLPPHLYPDGVSHRWSLRSNPRPDGSVRVVVTLDERSTGLTLAAPQVRGGASFDRFGFITPHIDGNGQEVYLDDLTFGTGK